MKILLVQHNPIIGDLDGNKAKVLVSIERAKQQGADIVLFSELMLCGYPPEDLVFYPSFIDSMMLHLEHIIKASKNIMVIVGLVRRNVEVGEKHLFNSAAVIYDGHLLGFQDKLLLPTYDVFNERRYFDPGESVKIWNIKGKKVGVTICEDIWQHAGQVDEMDYRRDPIFLLRELHPDLLVNLAASPFQGQKLTKRICVCVKAANTLKCPVLMCCQVGANGQLIFDGYSIYINERGQLCQLGKGFLEDEMLVDLKAQTSPILFKSDFYTNLLHALQLGVKDYCAKLGFKTALLGLSGGIDSALVAYIAARSLGPKHIIGVSMPSCYTPLQSQDDAEKLAKRLGIQFIKIAIRQPFDAFLRCFDPHFQRKREDVTEENLQARIRAIILMALSNKYGHIVLGTGNKSELSLGYSTLYGDMCGGLGVIGDVMKTMVYQLCEHINKIEKEEMILESIIKKPPSAELRPNQLDRDSLPEYFIVDSVLKGYVEDCLSINEIAEKYHISQEQVIELIQWIHKAEYKRRQGPPILCVSQKPFGIGRRYPVVQKWL